MNRQRVVETNRGKAVISRKMKIEAVVICLGYDDFLQATLPHNLPHVDHLTVVTSPEDKATQSFCHRVGVPCLPTHVFFREGGAFNKARGINYGLANQRCDDWILHLDADIVLPPMTRKMLMNAELQEDCIYGIDRVNCPSHDEWEAFLASPELQYEWSCLVKPPRTWPLGARIAHGDYGGYVPIGFFQLFHGSAWKRYPIVQDGDAEHTDVLHGIRWDRPKRVLLPEIIAIHLESEPAPMGVNWKGRKTRRFGPAEDRACSAANPPVGDASSAPQPVQYGR